MAMFGLSPLFLSVLASAFFTDPETGLNVTLFLKFHAIMTGSIHLIGAIALKLPSEPKVLSLVQDREPGAEPDERSALLPLKPADPVNPLSMPADKGNSVLDLLRDRNFMLLFIIALIVLGSVSSLLPFSTFLNFGCFLSAKW